MCKLKELSLNVDMYSMTSNKWNANLNSYASLRLDWEDSYFSVEFCFFALA